MWITDIEIYDLVSRKCHSQGLVAACQGFNCTGTNWRPINDDDNGDDKDENEIITGMMMMSMK